MRPTIIFPSFIYNLYILGLKLPRVKYMGHYAMSFIYFVSTVLSITSNTDITVTF